MTRKVSLHDFTIPKGMLDKIRNKSKIVIQKKEVIIPDTPESKSSRG